MSNPCACIGAIPQPPPPCPTEECCLKACSAILPCDQGVGPCAQTGTFDLSTLDHLTTGCTATPEFFLVSFDKTLLSAVTIDKLGVVTWTTAGTETANEYPKVLFGLTCKADCDDCIVLTSIGEFIIGIKDECTGVICDVGEECNMCDGTCEAVEVESETSST